MANLKLFKVTSLPPILEPSSLYFVKASTTTFSLYLTDKDGTVTYRSPDSSDISTIIFAIINSLLNQPDGIAGLDSNGNLIANVIAQIDGQNTSLQSNNDYVWRDLLAPFTEIAAVNSGNRPTYGNIFGNFRGLLFSYNTMQQVWVDFHVDHDYALGTMLYPHVHWAPTTTGAGTVRWGIEYSIAKGHGQEVFGTSSTIYIEHAFTANNQWRHYVSEPPEGQGIPGALIEPDTVIKCRVFRDAANINDTYNANIHAWQSDLHYQAARIGTRHRVPDFYNP